MDKNINTKYLFSTNNNNGNNGLFTKLIDKKHLDEAEELNNDNENWLDLMLPYSDLVTILLVFFIFFYIFNVFSENIADTKKSITEQFSVTEASTAEPIDSTKAIIDKEKLEKLTKADQDTIGGLKEYLFTISGEVLFESGQAKLKRMAESTLRLVAHEIKGKIKNDPNWVIRVEGHTDNIPINTLRYNSNWELSTARAISVVRFFLENFYFKPDQLQAMGYGEFNPIASNLTSQGRKMNRRVEIKLTYINQ